MKRARGFTLIELIIVTILLGIMAAILAPLAVSSLRAYNYTLGDVMVMDKLRYATERLAREIREVTYNPTTGFAFGSMTANSMAFTRNFSDSSGTITTSSVIVCNDGATVGLNYATSCTGAPVLTDELNGSGGLDFVYFDQNGNTLALTPLPLTAVRSVQITLTLTHNGNPYTQTTRVELKNFRPS